MVEIREARWLPNIPILAFLTCFFRLLAAEGWSLMLELVEVGFPVLWCSLTARGVYSGVLNREPPLGPPTAAAEPPFIKTFLSAVIIDDDPGRLAVRLVSVALGDPVILLY